MESLNIDPSVTVKLPTSVWFHICPQACRHGVARVQGGVFQTWLQASNHPVVLRPRRHGTDVCLGFFFFFFLSSLSTWQLLHLSSPFGMLFFVMGLFFGFFSFIWINTLCVKTWTTWLLHGHFCSFGAEKKKKKKKTLNMLYDRM